MPAKYSRNAIFAANREAYRRMMRQRAPLCQVVSDEELTQPLQIVDAAGWLGGDIRGWHVLCLAAGGGRQSCLYAAAGADVTVLDLSPDMLQLDREAARQRGFPMRIIEGSMDDLSMIDSASMDLVVHPVSTCYVPDVRPVFAAVAGVLKPGGLYVSQHKSPVSLQSSCVQGRDGRYVIEHPYVPGQPLPEPPPNKVATRLREPGAMEFLHRLEDLLGGIGRAGMVIEDVIEPDHTGAATAASSGPSVTGSFSHRAKFIAPYIRIKARRVNRTAPPDATASHPPTSGLWLPGT